jgi:hypothetical protein
MCIGALIPLLVTRRSPKVAETYTIPVTSGVIARESLMGVAIVILVTLKILC